MSDFDKEAERQRLREKYEADEAEREVTQQMSELLLRGATMTNKHCDRCHNPVFRYEGEEFCPVCQGAAAGEGGNGSGRTDTEANATAETATEADGTASTGDAAATAGTPSVAETEAPEPRPERTADATENAAPRQARSGDAGDLSAARASLVRTLTDLAERAESASDVGRQRDLLAGAREAAEAIEALDRTR